MFPLHDFSWWIYIHGEMTSSDLHEGLKPQAWGMTVGYARVVVLERPCRGRRGSGATPLIFFFLHRDNIFPGQHFSRPHFRDRMIFRWFFGTWFFSDGFLFPIKELGFWTNPGHWVRVLDVAGSYMYIVL